MKLVLHGAFGRMGRRIAALSAGDCEIVGAVDVAGIGQDIGALAGIGPIGVPVTGDLRAILGGTDVVIDFSNPAASVACARACGAAGVPLVIGTTGFTAGERAEIARAVEAIPCVLAPNMSVGVNLLFMLVEKAASILGDEYDIEIVEVHHRFKKDSPSGTAARLAEIAADATGASIEDRAVYGRKGVIGERTRREIGIHAVRLGDVVGEHTVSFGTIGERIELTHKAQSRDAFATGAIRAASFVCTAAPGLYDMQDVLGMK